MIAPGDGEKDGDCYQAAADLAVDLWRRNPYPALSDPVLVHGSVYDPDLDYHGHAWVEATHHFGDIGVRVVLDVSNGNNCEFPREFFYEIGRITDTTCYPETRALVAMSKAGHYGPWEKAE